MATAPNPGSPGDPDPSMDDILASIRRILSDEEKAAKTQRPDDGVLMLDPSMMVDAGTPADDLPHQNEPFAKEVEPHSMNVADEHKVEPDPMSHAFAAPDPLSPGFSSPEPAREPVETPAPRTLVAPEAAAMAASSVGTLMRTLTAERNSVVHRGGPSIEDVVREEIRPLLKQWLDTHLPPLVERLVRAEIERVVGRIGT